MKRQLLSIVVALTITLGIGLLVAPHVQAFDFNDLNLQITTNSTLNGTSTVCKTQTVGNIINTLQGNFVKNFLGSLAADLKAELPQLIFKLASCILQDQTYYGTGSGGSLSCAIGVGSDVASELKTQEIEKIKGTIISQCTAIYNVYDSINDSRRIINENGRDGGPAFVEDWQQFAANSRYRGLQVARNQMANTYYCPWVQGAMQGYYNFDSANAVANV